MGLSTLQSFNRELHYFYGINRNTGRNEEQRVSFVCINDFPRFQQLCISDVVFYGENVL